MAMLKRDFNESPEIARRKFAAAFDEDPVGIMNRCASARKRCVTV